MIYKRNDPGDLKVFNEVHIYIAPDTTITTGDYALRLSDITKIELIRKDKARTTRSHVAGTIGIIGAFALVITGASALAAFQFENIIF